MGLSLGAYLSHPVTDKHSSDEENSKMSYGVSSMQGWRETQEDAHNCILDFDGDTSFFAVYDGHGGNEVSEYTSQHLPNFLKENEYYKKGDYEKALKDSFVKFDCTLKEPEVVKVLQKLAKYNDGNDEAESESDEDNLGNLKAEAKMSIEEVMAKYVSCHKEKKQNNSEAAQSSDKSSNKDSVRFSEVSSNETECSSSKSNKSFNESDSEVSSSSSSCAVSRKSLSEKYNANGKLCKSMLDSTSNGSEEMNSSCSSRVDRLTAPESCDSGVGTSKAESDCSFKSPPENDESTPSSGSSLPKKSSCNGQLDDNKTVDDAISSSVENGEAEGSKGKGKGKALVKHHPKTKEDKKEESSEKLFQKFIHSESNEEMSESDSDDVTFNGPESRSDDDDDDDDEVEEGDEEDDEDDDDDDDDDEDDEDDDEDDDSEQYENEMDRCFMEPGSESGCTALVALIKGKKLYVANAGDCRCVVSKNGEAVEMSFDHKPENDIELKRIEKAGGRVNAGRVNDGLNLSRALGDHVYKRTPDLPPEEQMISPLPDIEVLDLEPDVEFMVLACDGIWNSMSSKEVVDFVRPRLLEKPDNLSKICEQLFDHCLAPNTLCDGTGCDNMTAIIVQFKDSKMEAGGAASSSASKKRSLDESSEAEESTKKLKTEDVSSTDSIGSSQLSSSSTATANADGFLEKSSGSPDTTQ